MKMTKPAPAAASLIHMTCPSCLEVCSTLVLINAQEQNGIENRLFGGLGQMGPIHQDTLLQDQ